MLRQILRNKIKYDCGCITYSRRFLRRRGEHKNLPLKKAEVLSSSFSQSLDEASVASESSLDSIRAEIARMRLEEDSEKRVATDVNDEVGSPKKRAGTLLSKEVFIQKTKSNETFWKGSDVLEGVKARDRILRKKLFLDAEEVLRKKNKEDTLHYLELAYNCIGSHRREESLTIAKELDKAVRSEMAKLLESTPVSEETANAQLSYDELKPIAWVNVLSDKTDDELYKLWKLGILDLDTIEGLSSMNEAEENPSVVGEIPSSSFVDESTEEENKKNEIGEEFLFSIEQNIEMLKDVEGIHEIMSCLKERMLLGAPNIDIAPTLQRVQQKKYEDVSEAELRMLERYEEKVKVVKVSMDSDIYENKSQTKDEGDSSTLENSSTLAMDEVKDKKATASSEVEVTESTIDSALCPSNSFLHAVSLCDDQLRHSLDGMEKIKRRALFDPEFQAAIKQAHTMEELSVRAHLNGNGDKSDSHVSSRRRSRSNRAHNAHPLLGGPLARPYHSADTPFFFGSRYSFVPPRGRYNLPAVRDATPHNRRLKRKLTRMRYSQ